VSKKVVLMAIFAFKFLFSYSQEKSKAVSIKANRSPQRATPIKQKSHFYKNRGDIRSGNGTSYRFGYYLRVFGNTNRGGYSVTPRQYKGRNKKKGIY
jgi:hypothetical protein